MEGRLKLLPHELKCLIVAGVDRPSNLRTGCQWLLGVVDDCTTSLSFQYGYDFAPSTQAVLGLVQRTPLLASLTIRRWWPQVQWATVLAACTGLQALDIS